MRRLSPVGLTILLLGGCTEFTSETPPAGATFSLIEQADHARRDFDETLFRSVRKDGRLVNAVTMEGRTELALTPPVPSRLAYDLSIPEDPVLRFPTGVAALGAESLAAPIVLRMLVEAEDGETEVFSDVFRRRAFGRWRDHEVDLARWSGKRIRLLLVTEWQSTREIQQPVLAAWGDPVVASESANLEKPHLVLVSVDCLRADHVSAYGYPRETTPHVDAVAAEGTVFENAFATASWTLPTHMSMLTGLLPSFHGATKWEKLSSGIDYLPSMLAEAGYRTSGVVSWVYLSQAYGFERGFHSYTVLDEPEASDIVDAALRELERGYGRPQFLFVHVYDPHWPYLPPDDLLERFGPRPEDLSDLMEKTSSQTPPQNDREVEEVIRLYDAEVAFADRELGRLFQALRDRGLYDETLLVITSDHGEAFYEHGHWQHSETLYDEVTRIPLIVKWPGAPEPNRSSRLVSQIDIFASLAEAAGVGLPGPEEGFLSRIPLATPEAPERTLLSEITWRSPNGTFMKVSLRDERLKYIATLSGPIGDDLGITELDEEELYDLSSDPKELRNRIDAEPSRARTFRSELRSFLDAARAARSVRQGEAVELDEATLEKLRSLGYAH